MVDPVRTRRAFSALRHSRSRSRSGPLWVVRADAPNVTSPDDAPSPVGACVAYAIGKAVGGAVVRNRIRRRLRVLVDEAEQAGMLTPGLYLVGVRSEATAVSFDGLRRHLHLALAGLR